MQRIVETIVFLKSLQIIIPNMKCNSRQQIIPCLKKNWLEIRRSLYFFVNFDASFVKIESIEKRWTFAHKFQHLPV